MLCFTGFLFTPVFYSDTSVHPPTTEGTRKEDMLGQCLSARPSGTLKDSLCFWAVWQAAGMEQKKKKLHCLAVPEDRAAGHSRRWDPSSLQGRHTVIHSGQFRKKTGVPRGSPRGTHTTGETPPDTDGEALLLPTEPPYLLHNFMSLLRSAWICVWLRQIV